MMEPGSSGARNWLTRATLRVGMSSGPCKTAQPAGYPAHLVRHGRLASGVPWLIRPIKPQDMALERQFVLGLSDQTRYRRLLSPRKLLPGELRRLTHIDYQREMALAALVGPSGQRRMIGVSRYAPDPHEGGHDFAIVIADAYQGLGLGHELLQALLDAARQAGLERLHGITLADNHGMLALAQGLGFARVPEPGDAQLVRLERNLAAPDEVPAWHSLPLGGFSASRL